MYPVVHDIVVWMTAGFGGAYTYVWKQFLPWRCFMKWLKTLVGPRLLPDVHYTLTNGTYVRQCSSSSVATWAGTALPRRKRADLHSTPLPCAWKHKVQHARPVRLLCSRACSHTLHPREQKTLLPLLQKRALNY